MAKQCGLQGCKHWRDCESISQIHCVKAWRNLVRLWRAQKLCDVVICVDGERYLCHGIVPASTSPFFRRAFLKRTEMSAMDSILCEKEVVIDFMKKEIFEKVLNFMYTADIVVAPHRVRELILAGAKLEMQTLISAIMRQALDAEIARLPPNRHAEYLGACCAVDHCGLKKMILEREKKDTPMSQWEPLCRRDCGAPKGCEEDVTDDEEAPIPCGELKYPSDHITPLRIMDELRIQGDMKTLAFAQTFCARNFAEISSLPSFQDASVHTVAALLDDDRINLEEYQIFKAMCRWLESSQMHIVHGPYLLSKIRLQLLTPQQLTNHVETKDYLMRKKKSRVLILEAFRFHCLRKTSPERGPESIECRGQKPRAGLDAPDPDMDDDDWVLNSEGKLIKQDKDSPYCPIEPCACCPDYMILSGGIDTKSKNASDGIYKYEEKENSWLRFARMQHARNHHAVVYVKGFLYIIGGSDPSLTGPGTEVCPIASCYKLNLETMKWNKIEAMSTPRMSLQAVAMGNYIYAIGGQDHKQRILRDVERYSISNGVWEYSSSLETAKAGLAVCVHRGRIFTAGGYCHKNAIVVDTVDSFDGSDDNWVSVGSLRFPRCFCNLANCLGRMYVLGGAWLDSEMDCSNFSSVYDVDIYNDESNLWEGVTALRLGRHDSGIAVLGPRIYIVGGKHCDDGEIKNLDTVECFDVEKDDWVDGVTPLPLPLLGPAITNTK